MSWEFSAPFDAGHRAALGTGKDLVFVAPPAGWCVAPLFAALTPSEHPRLTLVVLVPEHTAGLDLAVAARAAAALQPVHVLTGRARAERLLRDGAIRTLIATPPDALALLERASLKLAAVPQLALAWPAAMDAVGQTHILDTLLAEARGVQRLVITADETAVAGFIERHAHRAPIAVASRLPEAPSGALRYVCVGPRDRPSVARDLLDQLHPDSASVWDPSPDREPRWAGLLADPGVDLVGDEPSPRVQLAIAADLPSAEVVVRLRELADEIVVLLRSGQLPYLGRLAAPLRPMRVTGESDRARARSFRLRQKVRERLELGGLDAELLALEPLFAEHDPALVAAAAAAATGIPDRDTQPDIPAWVRVHVNVGRTDRLRPADLVGALVNAVGVAKDRIGKIEIRDRFTLVEIRAGDAERVVRGLTGVTIRGRRTAARLDRR